MKSRGWFPSRNWPDRVGETFAALVKHDEELATAVIEHDALRSPAQAFLFTRLDKEHQQAAARKLVKFAKTNDDETRWTPELVQLVAALPAEESLPILREAWEEFSLRDAITLELVKTGDAVDRKYFFEALSSIQENVVEAAAKVIPTIVNHPSDDEWVRVFQSLRQLCYAPQGRTARRAVLAILKDWTGENFEIFDKNGNLLASYQPWFDWFAEHHPELSKKLAAAGGDAAAFKERLTKIDWTTGDIERGKLAYEKRSCMKCHAGASPLGPDLTGAAGRFSKDDLFAAIVEPSKDVAPLYQATQIETGSGRSYFGLVVYESPDGTLLTTGPDTTLRIAGDEILSMRKSRLSIMPTGLLNTATDEELADLHAYLATLKAKK